MVNSPPPPLPQPLPRPHDPANDPFSLPFAADRPPIPVNGNLPRQQYRLKVLRVDWRNQYHAIRPLPVEQWNSPPSTIRQWAISRVLPVPPGERGWLVYHPLPRGMIVAVGDEIELVLNVKWPDMPQYSNPFEKPSRTKNGPTETTTNYPETIARGSQPATPERTKRRRQLMADIRREHPPGPRRDPYAYGMTTVPDARPASDPDPYVPDQIESD